MPDHCIAKWHYHICYALVQMPVKIELIILSNPISGLQRFQRYLILLSVHDILRPAGDSYSRSLHYTFVSAKATILASTVVLLSRRRPGLPESRAQDRHRDCYDRDSGLRRGPDDELADIVYQVLAGWTVHVFRNYGDVDIQVKSGVSKLGMANVLNMAVTPALEKSSRQSQAPESWSQSEPGMIDSSYSQDTQAHCHGYSDLLFEFHLQRPYQLPGQER